MAYWIDGVKNPRSYRDGDDIEDFGIKVVGGKVRRDWGLEDRHEQWLYLTPSDRVTRRDMLASLHQFARRCYCEHDCCGCYNGGAWGSTLKGRGRRWKVLVSYSRNV